MLRSVHSLVAAMLVAAALSLGSVATARTEAADNAYIERNEAIATLLNDATQLVENGDLDAASVAVERALRIDPSDATLWRILADVRKRQGRPEQAEALLAKAATLTPAPKASSSASTATPHDPRDMRSRADQALGGVDGGDPAIDGSPLQQRPRDPAWNRSRDALAQAITSHEQARQDARRSARGTQQEQIEELSAQLREAERARKELLAQLRAARRTAAASDHDRAHTHPHTDHGEGNRYGDSWITESEVLREEREEAVREAREEWEEAMREAREEREEAEREAYEEWQDAQREARENRREARKGRRHWRKHHREHRRKGRWHGGKNRDWQEAAVKVPRGHFPPPGLCRAWFSDRPPGHQPAPRPCFELRHELPPGATLLVGNDQGT